jgi:hypothetical protein
MIVDNDDDNVDDDDDGATLTRPCPSCGLEVYEDAERCPICGDYITPNWSALQGMPWRWIVMGLLGFVAVLMALMVMVC